MALLAAFVSVALNARGATRIVGARSLEGVQQLEEARERAVQLGDEAAVADALVNLGSALGEIREHALASDWLERAISYTADRDLDAARHYVTAWLARVRLGQGRWDEAERLADGLELDPGASPVSAIVRLSALGLLRARRGAAVGDALEEAWRLAVRTDDLQRLWPVVAARAEAAWLTGSGTDDVAADLVEVDARAADLDLAWAQDELAHWRQRLGGPRAVAADGHGTPFALHSAGRALEAAAAWRALGCPYEQAWAQLEAGDEASVREALGILLELGAAPLADRARRRLRALGATSVPRGPRTTTTTHPSALTARQLAVLELVAAGLTDRQIGERLFLSTKTVGHHVSAILARLGVDGRTAAARLALDRGWIDAAPAPVQH